MEGQQRSSDLASEAAAMVPPGDPFGVAGTSLPAMMARQDRMKARMLARGDRLGELIAAGLDARLEGDRLLSEDRLSADQAAEVEALAPEAADAEFKKLTDAVDRLRTRLASLDPCWRQRTYRSTTRSGSVPTTNLRTRSLRSQSRSLPR